MKNLSGKNILLTGAASGIGRLMAGRFAAEGARLVLLDINETLLETAKSEIHQSGAEVSAHVCDIGDEKQVDRVLKNVQEETKEIDILINNAGIVKGGLFLDMSLEDIAKVLNVNLMGMIRLTHKLLPRMTARKAGHIVNIASSAGFIAMPRMSEYCASKFAALGWSDALRQELKSQGCEGIQITVVCPYAIATGMFAGFQPLLFNPMLKPEKVADRIVAAVKKQKPYLFVPAYMKCLYALKLLPTGLQDALLSMLGSGSAMVDFSGSAGMPAAKGPPESPNGRNGRP
jgi:short-subunit dehydrogenase